MFSTSTQLKHWTFGSQAELNQLRFEANHRFIAAHYDGNMDDDEAYAAVQFSFTIDFLCGIEDDHRLDIEEDPLRKEFFLDAAEESVIRRYYESQLRLFCNSFSTPLPSYIVSTAVSFYKRFFVHNSVMDYHPKDIIYPCVYLACKVEEYYITVDQFVACIEHMDVEQARDLVLSQELLLMEMLHFHLTVHNPYRPLEGLMIDIKTRCPSVNPEEFRNTAVEFIDKSLQTDAPLLHSPSQIALTALYVGGSKKGVNLDSYVANKLVDGRNDFVKLSERVQAIRSLVRNIERLDMELLESLETKLERCRNQENNPCSELYKYRIDDMLDVEKNNRNDVEMDEFMAADDDDPLTISSLQQQPMLQQRHWPKRH